MLLYEELEVSLRVALFGVNLSLILPVLSIGGLCCGTFLSKAWRQADLNQVFLILSLLAGGPRSLTQCLVSF